MAHISSAHIEHYRPRETYPDLVVDWGNLTIACPTCNGTKSAKFDESIPFVNPFHDDPDDHFIYNGDVIFAPFSHRGFHTITEIGLNRYEAIKARGRRIEFVNAQLTYWHAAPAAMKPSIEVSILKDMFEGEYFAIVRAHLQAVHFPGA